MCGRYAIHITPGFQARFGVDDVPPEVESRYNVAPSQTLPVVVANSPRRVALMRWGFTPSWSKDGKAYINARAETVHSSPAFRAAFAARRCLAPATGFYEWAKSAIGKTPYFIHPTDTDLVSFAGIYETWRDAQGIEMQTYAIITTVPDELIEPIHNRMPVLLRQADEGLWLDKSADAATLRTLLAPYPAEAMAAYPVSLRVNAPRNDDPSLLLPAI